MAARIVDVASPGELLVSEALRTAGDHHGVTFDEVGPVMMKGLEPISLFRVERALVSSGGVGPAVHPA